MRIVGGELRGRRYSPPKSFNGRPTTDFAKEGLMNILQNHLEFDGLSFLDLFSGTGAISYEFLSRGTEDIIAIDASIVHVNYVNKMFREFDAKKARCIKKDSFQFLLKTELTFDVIFADPPFDLDRLADIPQLVFDQGVLNEDGLLILEHSKEHLFDQHPNFVKEKKYGHVRFSFFEHQSR